MLPLRQKAKKKFEGRLTVRSFSEIPNENLGLRFLLDWNKRSVAYH